MRQVELVPAHLWVCDECGTENFERCIALAAEHYAELKQALGVYPWEDLGEGQFLTAPSDVTCRQCGEFYETVEFGGRIDE